jgi:hypothetical protein
VAGRVDETPGRIARQHRRAAIARGAGRKAEQVAQEDEEVLAGTPLLPLAEKTVMEGARPDAEAAAVGEEQVRQQPALIDLRDVEAPTTIGKSPESPTITSL